jgi:hypothetical protein
MSTRACRKPMGGRRYVYRAIDQFGQVIDVFAAPRRDAAAARRFLERAIGTTKRAPVEVITDKAAAYPAMLDELLPGAWHRTDQYANHHTEADHGRLKSRLRQHHDLVAEHQQLGVLRRRTPCQQRQPPHHLAEHQVEQSQDHGPIIVAPCILERTCSSTHPTDFRVPTGSTRSVVSCWTGCCS